MQFSDTIGDLQRLLQKQEGSNCKTSPLTTAPQIGEEKLKSSREKLSQDALCPQDSVLPNRQARKISHYL